MTDFAVGTEIKGKDRASRAFGKVARMVRGTLKKAFVAAGRGAKRLASGVANATKKVALMGTAAAGAAAFGISRLVSDVAKGGDDLAKFSRRAGITAQTYAEIQHAAGLAGVSTTEFGSAIVKMTRTLGELKAGKGSGALNALLDKVNPGFKEMLKGAKDNEEALDMLLKGMGRLEDPSKRAALAAAAFGRAGQMMTLMLEGGEEGLLKARREFSKYAGVITKEGLKASEDYVDAQARVDLSIAGVKRSIGEQLLPVLGPMLEKMATWIAANRELIGQKVSDAIAGIAKWLQQVNWDKVLSGIGKFVDGLSSALTFLWDIKEVILVIAGASVLGKLVGGLTKAGDKLSGLVKAAAAAALAIAVREKIPDIDEGDTATKEVFGSGALGAELAGLGIAIRMKQKIDRLQADAATKGHGFQTGSQVEEAEKGRLERLVTNMLTGDVGQGVQMTDEQLRAQLGAQVGRKLSGGGSVSEEEAQEVIDRARKQSGIPQPLIDIAAQLKKGTEARMQIDVNVVTQPGTKATVTGSAVQTTQPGAVAVKATVGTPSTRVTP